VRILRGLGFTICLFLMVFQAKVSAAEWIGDTIVIEENGSVECSQPDPPLRRIGATYYLADDIRIITRKEGIVVKKSNIVVEGNGRIIAGCGGFTSECGILLEKVNNVTLRNVSVVDFENGIGFNFSSGNNLVECTFSSNNLAGVFLYSSSNNKIVNCTVSKNRFGIVSWSSFDNVVYHNNFIYNANQAFCVDSQNIWDNGYPSGGNYWSDYASVDYKSSQNQDEPGADGILDEPFFIGLNNRDYYPLATPYGTARYRVSSLSISPDSVNAGQPSTISVKVENIGESSGSYEVKLEVNEQTVDTKMVSLGSGESMIVGFTYKPVKDGYYIIGVNGLTGSLRVSKEEPPWLIIIVVAVTIMILMIILRRRHAS